MMMIILTNTSWPVGAGRAAPMGGLYSLRKLEKK